jgi:hypothetical protein
VVVAKVTPRALTPLTPVPSLLPKLKAVRDIFAPQVIRDRPSKSISTFPAIVIYMSSGPSFSTVDFHNTLCLACSSSLPPSKSTYIFVTNCCSRPICPGCLSSNPRLARYDPCLACLGGVGAIFVGNNKGKQASAQNINVDGAVRDEDTFVLGDDDDDESEDERSGRQSVPSSPPPYSSPIVESGPSPPGTTQESGILAEEAGASSETAISTPSKYYIKPNDNLQGIALRFRVNVSSIIQSCISHGFHYYIYVSPGP